LTRTASFLLALVLSAAAHADDALWKRLATEENLVVLMRHANASGGRPLAWDPTGQCLGEMALSAKGRQEAKRLGEAFAARGIAPVVITSPMCRCRETATIAFGDRYETDPLLREIASADASRTSAFEAKAQSMISAARGRKPVVFVSHRPNIDVLSLELVDEGELLVARANGKGEVDVLGRMRIGDAP
jgi:phosphohistidine phosphatase SixA